MKDHIHSTATPVTSAMLSGGFLMAVLSHYYHNQVLFKQLAISYLWWRLLSLVVLLFFEDLTTSPQLEITVVSEQ